MVEKSRGKTRSDTGKRLKGKAAVVTGAGGGIGQQTALLLAAEGASVVVNDTGGNMLGEGPSGRPADETVQMIKEQGGAAIANYDSVADYAKMERMIQSCVDNFGRLDILVCHAGIVGPGTIYEMSEKDWDSLIEVHLKGTFNCCRHAVMPMMKQGSGRIVKLPAYKAGHLI
jgi:NAD(P)-dependent dehydrogenase (short-subunit alcohol dehydrogenase family)